MMHGSFLKIALGKLFGSGCMKKRKIDPQALLFVNDYNVISYGEHHAYKAHINELRQLGAPIEAIGVQGHFEERVDPVIVKRGSMCWLSLVFQYGSQSTILFTLTLIEERITWRLYIVSHLVIQP